MNETIDLAELKIYDYVLNKGYPIVIINYKSFSNLSYPDRREVFILFVNFNKQFKDGNVFFYVNEKKEIYKQLSPEEVIQATFFQVEDILRDVLNDSGINLVKNKLTPLELPKGVSEVNLIQTVPGFNKIKHLIDRYTQSKKLKVLFKNGKELDFRLNRQEE